MQNKISVNFTPEKFLFRAKTPMPIDDFTFVPSCPANLGLGIIYLRNKEGVIQFVETTACSTEQLPEGAAKVKAMAAFVLYPYAFASRYASLLTNGTFTQSELHKRVIPVWRKYMRSDLTISDG